MRDPYLNVLAVVAKYPGRPLKFYVEESRVSRGTFFKVKSDLELRGALLKLERRQISLNREKSLSFLADAYPGVTITLPNSVEDRRD